MTNFFVQFPKEMRLSFFEKKNFTSKSSPGHVECIIDNSLENSAKK